MSGVAGWAAVLRLHLRRGLPLFVIPLVAVLVSFMLWSDGWRWGARWNQLANQARIDLIIVGPVCVALGAWLGGRPRRSGEDELVASTRRSALARVTAEITAAAVAVGAGMLLSMVAPIVVTAIVGGWGTSAAIWLAAAPVPFIFAYCALGYCIGRVSPWRVTAPLAAVATYLVTGIGVFTSVRAEILTGSGWLGDDVYGTFNLPGLLLSAALAASAALLATALAGAELRPFGGRRWLAVAAAAGGVLALLAPTTSALDYPEAPRTPAQVCASGEPRVCVHAADQHLLDETTVQARQVIRRMRDIPGAPTWAGPSTGNAILPAQMLPVQPGATTPFGAHAEGDEASMVGTTTLFSFDQWCAGPNGFAEGVSDEVQTRSLMASEWAGEGRVLQEDGNPLSPRLAASSPRQRDDFAGRMLAAAKSCDPAAAVAAADALAP